ncbi:SRPBCC family protein [Nocardioides sp. SYSU D00038]|uniref:SRPBCC family protein n=1 Tax=Nocardioides sp. SYSU D00038 TaxID=2812554 RepID=UPI0019683071|nr:SRPBCC family protein [Nocardioides sp. SYSU D00038]
MDFDPASHLGAVRRRLTTTSREGVELRLLTVERTFDAAQEEVWEALTTADRIERWMLPVTGDLRVGGRFQLEDNAGGEVLECVEPERLAITWEYGGQLSWVDVSLRPVDDGTLLQLDHAAPVDPQTWEEFGPGAVGIGWEMGLLGMALHLANPGAPRPDVSASPELVELMTGSSKGWAEAEVAAGGDPERARAAADRTLAAYTATPEE